MLKKPLLKKTQRGFGHHIILPILVVLSIAGIGTYLLTQSKAATEVPLIAKATPITSIWGKCLTNEKGIKKAGNTIKVRACEGRKYVPQQWTLRSDRSMRNGSGYCLDTAAGGTTPGTKVIQWTCTGNLDQQWVIDTADQTIRNPYTGLCLSYATDSTQVIIDTCREATPRQHWNAAITSLQQYPPMPKVPKVIARTSGATSRFTVATFNVLGYHYTAPGTEQANQGYKDGITRIDRTMKMLEDNKVDVVGLQEFEPEQYDRLRAKYAGDTSGDWLVYPTPLRKDTHNIASAAILWRKSKFTLIASGHRIIKAGSYSENVARQMEAPWVKLKENATGKVFYLTNNHDAPPNQAKNAPIREANQRANLADIKKKLRDAPVIATGDFNSGWTWDAEKDAGIAKTSISYCILTNGGYMTNAHDISRYIKAGVTGEYFKTAARSTIPACPYKTGRIIDHIYVSNKILVNNWIHKAQPTDNSLKSSDHSLYYSNVSIQ